ncbi:hypothetical protein DYU11_20190 [Fibrisoma montanum]|uniref:Uncharacterized protein n=1 Tax=Fibrisoma montanum TaxID=2305895 RepID=A0A418M3Z5_9BACT|nr:hypothetical protein [Fibrisoma montanum]RIV20373.1 hypothetical protein DYU11_20190 [Fibrisoma montanum]
MTKQPKTEHTGFRNGALFCFHCGVSQPMPLPMPVTLASDFMKSFAKLHRSCKKTWTEPVNATPSERTEKQNAMWWLANGERGVSSETIFKYLSDDVSIERSRWESHPLDPSDFRRCHLLLEAVPQFRAKLDRMRAVSPVWARLVDHWGKLTDMLLEQMVTRKDNGMYDFMKSLGC